MDKCFEALAAESFRKSINDFLHYVKTGSVNLENDPISPSNGHTSLRRQSATCNHCLCSPPIIPRSCDLPQQNLSYRFQNRLRSLLEDSTAYAAKKLSHENDLVPAAVYHKNDSHTNNSPSDTVSCTEVTSIQPPTKLFSWCPIAVEVDGGCSIAGLYRTENSSLPCAFTVTARVTSVSDNGRCITTANGKTYHLQGGICWSVYIAVTLDTTIDTIPSGIADAFSSGFPAQNWRTWTQGLFYHITGLDERKADHPPSRSVRLSSHNMESKRCSKSQAYTSPTDIDLDESIGCITDLQSDDYSDSVTEVVDNQPLFKAAPSRLFKEIDNRAQRRREPQHHKRPPQSPPQVATSRWRTDFRESERASKKRTSHRQHDKLPTQKKHAGVNTADESGVDDQYKLYTASGQVIDARKLPSTRSGRLIIPTLDSRFGHKLQISRNRIVSVQHDCDDTASWILRRRNQ